MKNQLSEAQIYIDNAKEILSTKTNKMVIIKTKNTLN